ncbi:hypothetical protein FACS1894200_11730 [Spirochaetia bacterium]|nr:hypothetical protein FACS1894200_11730 [Spirochaetia bacterium]
MTGKESAHIELQPKRLESEYKYALDLQSKVVHAKREGRKEGRQEGEQNKAIAVDREMKADGMPIAK